MTTTATYVSDNRIDVTWTVPSYFYAGSGRYVRLVREDAFGLAQVIANIPNPGPDAAMSYSDMSASANNRYRYRILGNVLHLDRYDPMGGYGNYVSTTPAAPSSVAATKTAVGDVVVAWWDNSPAETHFEIQDGTTALGTKTASPYTHLSPNNLVSHSYRVRAVADGPRYSAWSAYSNVVTILQPPAAPVNLTPNGGSVDVAAALTLAWDHNPLDLTPQTAYELRHRTVGAPSWTTVTGTTAEQRTVTDYATPQNIEWQVRTKGSHVEYSEWSAVAAVSLVTPPTVLVTAPADASTIATANVTVSWSYYHAGGGAQTGWQVEILDGATVVAQDTGADTANSWTSGNILTNLTEYTARLRVREPSGLWSQWETVAFDVDFPVPPASTGTATWQDGFGHVVITATAGAGSPATVSHDFARSTDGGNTWVTFATGLPLNVSALDWEAPAAGTYHYRITAVSALPSVAHSDPIEVTVPAVAANCVIWLGGGPGFAQVVKLAWNPVISYDGGRERALHAFAGRSVPVEFSSMRASKTIGVSATLMDTDVDSSSRADVEDLFDLPGPHCYRDPFGRVLYGTLSGLSWSREPGVGVGGVSFSITRSAPPDAAQAASLAGFYAPRIAEVAPGVYRFINADADEASPGVYVEVE